MNSLLRQRIWSSFSPSCRLYELEAVRPRVSAPATYRSGTPQLRFWISDFGFVPTIDHIELDVSDFAVGSRVLTSFSASFQSAIRNPRSAIVDPVARPPRLSEQARDGGQPRPSSRSRHTNS